MGITNNNKLIEPYPDLRKGHCGDERSWRQDLQNLRRRPGNDQTKILHQIYNKKLI